MVSYSKLLSKFGTHIITFTVYLLALDCTSKGSIEVIVGIDERKKEIDIYVKYNLLSFFKSNLLL